jgi:hypothetical protein
MRVWSFSGHAWTNGWTSETPRGGVMSPVPAIPDNVKEAVLAQGRPIAERLRREAGFSFSHTPAQIIWQISLVTSELVVGLSVGDFTYQRGRQRAGPPAGAARRAGWMSGTYG